jgi:hypothetical protein
MGQVGTGTQLTSIDPGNEPGGIFWTVSLPSSSVRANPGAGIATYRVSNLLTDDYGNTLNDLMHGPEVDATVSWTVQWSGVTANTQRSHLNPTNIPPDATNRFAGEFVVSQLPGQGTATMQWSTSEASLQYVSDPSTPSQCLWTVVGRERNGVFLS